MIKRRFRALFVAGLLATALPAHAADMRLVELIQLLRQQGHNILYSSDLVLGNMRVNPAATTLEELARVLPDQGLALQGEGGLWLIVQSDGLPAQPANDPAEAAAAEPENIIVTGSLHSFPNGASTASARRMAAADLAAVPSLASDIMRATLRLPGMSSVGISAKPYIRGGLKDEMLIMQDGVELLEPFHLADYHSAYSTLDYYTIEAVDFYTGGFPTRYGNRMSGVMDISNDWGEQDYRTNIGVSTFAQFINTRRDLPGQGDGSWAFSYRRGDLSDLTDYIQTRSGDPEYQDGSLRLNLPMGERSRVHAGLVYSEDDIKFDDTEESASSQIDTWYGWGTLEHRFSEQLQTALSLSYVDFQRQKNLRSFEEEEKGGLLDHDQQIERFGLRNDFSWWRKGVLHEFGWQLDYAAGEYDHQSRIDRGELADIIDTEREVDRDIQVEPDGWSAGLYWAGEWQLGDQWLLQPGLRWDWQDYYLQRDSDQQWSPRLGVAYDPDEYTRLRLSVGRFYQPEGVQELQVLDGVDVFYQPQRSDQVVAGLEWSRGDWELVAEAYYKHYDDTKGRFENIFNPFVLLPEMEPDRVGLAPDKARASGFDLDLSYDFSESLSASLRYSYMKAEDKLDGEWVDRRWSQEHTVNSFLGWQQDNWSLALAITWHSGWRSTELPGFVPEDEVIPVADVLNNTELRDYLSVDVSARYTWELRHVRVQVYADISNIGDRNNQAGIDFDIDEVEDESGYVITADEETLLDLVPSVGITLSF